MSSYIHPAGDDPIRSILLFAEAKPLGANGLYWLKIQVANMYGATKGSFEQRVNWTEVYTEKILATLKVSFFFVYWTVSQQLRS